MKIPSIMCHGVNAVLRIERFAEYYKIVRELGFDSINYTDLEQWRAGKQKLPAHPILFDFDHPVRSIHDQIFPVMSKFGFRGNLFVNTQPMEDAAAPDGPADLKAQVMSWDDMRALVAVGWQIGAHTHTHPSLSKLGAADPSGASIRLEMETNDTILQREFGQPPKDFAFTGTTWSRVAEQEAKKRYRFGRLWIIGSMYEADGQPIRFAELAGVAGPDEADGGPPVAARYITEATDPYRLPSMELGQLIVEYPAFRAYLTQAMEG